jgi:hypothetical protein
MKLTSQQLLHQLGNGASIVGVCEAAGMTRSEFDIWWKAEMRAARSLGARLAKDRGLERTRAHRT